MATFTAFDQTIVDAFTKKHDLSSDTLKIYLTNNAPNKATMSVKSDLPEITAGNGYPAGGIVLPVTGVSQTNGDINVAVDDPNVLTATGGSIASFRYAVLYNDTAVSKNLISFWDYGSEVNMNQNETFTIDTPANLITGGF